MDIYGMKIQALTVLGREYIGHGMGGSGGWRDAKTGRWVKVTDVANFEMQGSLPDRDQHLNDAITGQLTAWMTEGVPLRVRHFLTPYRLIVLDDGVKAIPLPANPYPDRGHGD